VGSETQVLFQVSPALVPKVNDHFSAARCGDFCELSSVSFVLGFRDKWLLFFSKLKDRDVNETAQLMSGGTGK
jgi:hypothetical protein